ncbi:hypothetical protein MN608_07931 [Microdochium nivale]|nr:hypothetical protein MN608_07931 [Microdochium nivale]
MMASADARATTSSHPIFDDILILHFLRIALSGFRDGPGYSWRSNCTNQPVFAYFHVSGGSRPLVLCRCSYAPASCVFHVGNDTSAALDSTTPAFDLANGARRYKKREAYLGAGSPDFPQAEGR